MSKLGGGMKKRGAAPEDDFSLFFNLELMGFPAASADSVVSVYPILSARPHLLYLRFPPSEPNRLVCVNSLLLQKKGGYSRLYTFANVPHTHNVHAGTAGLPLLYIRPTGGSFLPRLHVVFSTSREEQLPPRGSDWIGSDHECWVASTVTPPGWGRGGGSDNSHLFNFLKMAAKKAATRGLGVGIL